MASEITEIDGDQEHDILSSARTDASESGSNKALESTSPIGAQQQHKSQQTEPLKPLADNPRQPKVPAIKSPNVLQDQAEKEKTKKSAQADASAQQGMRPLAADDDYTRKYPNDIYGDEMGPNARVWRTYIDEKDIADKDYISDTNATLDGILVFASIFSAIVTTFVTQTYQSLMPDSQTVTQGLLAELIAVQRGAANGSSVNNIPSYQNSLPAFNPESSDVLLNSLWFISLVLSLLTVFLGVLTKQWLYQYLSVTSGTPRERALVRQARSLGLHDWQVPALIGFLPIILHLSLALFLVGLIILLRTLLPNIAYFGTAVVGAVYTVYIISNVLPVIYPRCPYRTALTPKIYQLCQVLLSLPIPHIASASQEHAHTSKLWQDLSWLRGIKLSFVQNKPTLSALWKDAERMNALNTKGALEIQALAWLYTSSYNPTAQQIVFEALAGLDPEHRGNWSDALFPGLLINLENACTHLCSTVVTSIEDTHRKLEVCLRALVQIQPSYRLFDEYHQLEYPLGVEYYLWKHEKECNPYLRTIFTCGLYFRKRSYGFARSRAHCLHNRQFFIDQPELSAGMWISLIEQEKQFRSEPHSFLWQLQSVKLLCKSQFLGKNLVPNLAPSMTLEKPTVTMCNAMLKSLSFCNSDSSESLSHSQILLYLISEFFSKIKAHDSSNISIEDNSPDISVEEICDTMILMLDCLLDILPLNHHSKYAENLSYKETSCIIDLMLDLAQDHTIPHLHLQNIQEGFLVLLDEFCTPRHPNLITSSVLDCYSDFALDIIWNEEYHAARMPYQLRGVGDTLLCLAFDRHHEPTYKSVCTKNILSNLYQKCLKQSYDMYGVSEFLHHFLQGVFAGNNCALTEPAALLSYTQLSLDYIHQPDSLYALCYILLKQGNSQGIDALVLLLCFQPKHCSWVQSLIQLKLYAQEKLISWDPKKTSAEYGIHLMAFLEGTLAIQKILDIHAHNQVLDSKSIEALAGNNGKELPMDNKLLVAYQLHSRSQVQEPEPEINETKMQWRDRLHNLLPSHKKLKASDVVEP